MGTPSYFQGFILYAYLFLFFILVEYSKIKLQHWAVALNSAALLVALQAIKDWISLNLFHLQVPDYAGRVVSTFGQPNFYAGFLLLTLPFSYFLFKRATKKISGFGLIVGIISAIGILVSYSRLAILLLFLLIILGFFDQLRIKFKVAVLFLIIISVILSASVFISLKFSSGMAYGELVKPINNKWLIDNSPEKRVILWPVMASLISKRPWLGYGLENISAAYLTFFKQIDFNINQIPAYYSLKDLIIDRSHNYSLDLMLFSGIFGLVCWLFLVGLMLKKAKGMLLVSLIIYLIWIQFQNQSIIQLLYFWLMVGLISKDH